MTLWVTLAMEDIIETKVLYMVWPIAKQGRAVSKWAKRENRHASLELFIYMVNHWVKTPNTQNMSIGRGSEGAKKRGEFEFEQANFYLSTQVKKEKWVEGKRRGNFQRVLQERYLSRGSFSLATDSKVGGYSPLFKAVIFCIFILR